MDEGNDPACGYCGHRKTKHDGVDDDAACWGTDDGETCDCPGFDPPLTKTS